MSLATIVAALRSDSRVVIGTAARSFIGTVVLATRSGLVLKTARGERTITIDEVVSVITA